MAEMIVGVFACALLPAEAALNGHTHRENKQRQQEHTQKAYFLFSVVLASFGWNATVFRSISFFLFSLPCFIIVFDPPSRNRTVR